MSTCQSVISSPNDHRSYRHLTLTNGLRVLLVQDMHSAQAAASIAVNVGHFDDPQSRPGMAHFLEHMLFLGTAKFPEAGGYHNFINQHGGSNNAWTGTEHTNFFFAIDPWYLPRHWTDSASSLLHLCSIKSWWTEKDTP